MASDEGSVKSDESSSSGITWDHLFGQARRFRRPGGFGRTGRIRGHAAARMKRYYGAVVAEPQGVTIKDNSTRARTGSNYRPVKRPALWLAGELQGDARLHALLRIVITCRAVDDASDESRTRGSIQPRPRHRFYEKVGLVVISLLIIFFILFLAVGFNEELPDLGQSRSGGLLKQPDLPPQELWWLEFAELWVFIILFALPVVWVLRKLLMRITRPQRERIAAWVLDIAGGAPCTDKDYFWAFPRACGCRGRQFVRFKLDSESDRIPTPFADRCLACGRFRDASHHPYSVAKALVHYGRPESPFPRFAESWELPREASEMNHWEAETRRPRLLFTNAAELVVCLSVVLWLGLCLYFGSTSLSASNYVRDGGFSSSQLWFLLTVLALMVGLFSTGIAALVAAWAEEYPTKRLMRYGSSIVGLVAAACWYATKGTEEHSYFPEASSAINIALAAGIWFAVWAILRRIASKVIGA